MSGTIIRLRQAFRFTLLLLLVLLGVALTVFLSPPGRRTPHPGKLHVILRQWWMKQAASILGLRIKILGEAHPGASLWVANHISWLDIPVLGAAGNVGFLSKAEIRQWPVIGWLAAKSGTLFIDRGGRNASQNAAEKISANILAGHSVLVFPEATTTDGSDVKRFHPRLFAPALDHGLSVQPVSIRYLDKQGKRHTKVPFINNERFLSNLLTVLGESSISVQVSFLSTLAPEGFSERRQLADLAHARIKAVVSGATDPPAPTRSL